MANKPQLLYAAASVKPLASELLTRHRLDELTEFFLGKILAHRLETLQKILAYAVFSLLRRRSDFTGALVAFARLDHFSETSHKASITAEASLRAPWPEWNPNWVRCLAESSPSNVELESKDAASPRAGARH